MTEAIFHKFFDDAAVFPPGLAPLDRAVQEHIQRAHDAVADRFVGPLVLPFSSIAEAAELAGSEPIDISAVGAADQLQELHQLLDQGITPSTIVGAELKTGGLSAKDALAEVAALKREHPDLDLYLELSYEQVTDQMLSSLADQGISLKFRTGGVTADLFPSSEQVVDVMALALEHGVPFKFTAGLHRAMRYTDEVTGFQHFGFANIAAAIDTLQRGGDKQAALAVLESDDQDAVGKHITAPDTTWREAFQSFGTCSVPEPTETLHHMGLMSPETVQRLTITPEGK